MRVKFAFVLGAAIGYVCGTRAGRQRYEQIKRATIAIWNTEPVQKGVNVVRETVDDRAGDTIAFVRRVATDAVNNYSKRADEKTEAKRNARAAKPKSSSAQTRSASPDTPASTE